MKTGIELIAKERQEQIEKHGYSIETDRCYVDGELCQAATAVIKNDENLWPFGWDMESFDKIHKKQPKERLIIAGALIAAEIDRLSYQE